VERQYRRIVDVSTNHNAKEKAHMSDTNTNEVDGLSKDFYHTREQEQKDESQLTVNEQGDWVYPTGAATGFVEVELPSLGINPTERLLVRDFGPHVAAKIESAMNTGYLRKHSPAQVFAHYTAVAEGASLLTKDALTRMQELSKEFAAEPERDEYYKQVLRPWLHSLSPRRR
jgi:hypothetical protein